jgi:hypothetical protein
MRALSARYGDSLKRTDEGLHHRTVYNFYGSLPMTLPILCHAQALDIAMVF